MPKIFLNLFFKISGFGFFLKQRMADTESRFKVLFYALLIIIIELFFVILAFPLYLIVSPKQLQKRGFVFSYEKYEVKRKISLAIFFSSVGIFSLKMIIVSVLSTFLIGGQILLAGVNSWSFDIPENYIYNSAKIEIVNGEARLKNLSSSVSGDTVNSGFDSNSTDWTSMPSWISAPGKTNTASYQSSGGNPDGYVDINLLGRKKNDAGGYWYQSFVTTEDSPTIATLNLDWKAISITGALSSYTLYAFIDTDSGDPVIGNEVWNSGDITEATSWDSISQVDISSKISIAGTYYLKIVAYHQCGSADCDTLSGFDNVVVDWSVTNNPSYAVDMPTINPAISLSPVSASGWDSFTETAVKNGGEIYYQLSDDDGSLWQYWDSSAWVEAGVGDYNNASVVNANIGDFSAVNKKIMWKAFFESDGSQQVILNTIDISYTENNLPNVLNIVGSQSASTTMVYINYDLQDGESDLIDLVAYEYSLTGDFAGEEAVMTASTTDLSHDGVLNLNSSSSSVSHIFVWDVCADLVSSYSSTTYIRLQADDGIDIGGYATSSDFTVDCSAPVFSNISVSQNVGATDVTINYELTDDTSGLLVEIDISDDGGISWEVVDISVSSDIGSDIIPGDDKMITWQAGIDFDNQEQVDMRVRLRASDGFNNQSAYYESSDFSVDTASPIGLSDFNKFSGSSEVVTLNWSSGVTDANFKHYELWHSSNQDDVQNRIGTAIKWDENEDANLDDINAISTTITKLSITDNYYIKIWAVDNFGNESTTASINIYEPEPEPIVSVGGGGPIVSDTTPPNKPILSPISALIHLTNITISGLAEPRSRIDLYDNEILIERLASVADNNGEFSQDFIFDEGEHVLIVKAVDFANNVSQFSEPIRFVIDLTLPQAPIILTPENNENITDTTPQLTGIAEPFSQLKIILNERNEFQTFADKNGNWEFILPSSFALEIGSHNFVVTAINLIGESDSLAVLNLNIIEPTAIVSPAIEISVEPSQPVSPEIIRETAEAAELSDLSRPIITDVELETGGAIKFTGTAAPNDYVVVYIQSEPTLVYGTQTNQAGLWSIIHSQKMVELSPRDHSIFAVVFDAAAKSKSRPSLVSMFTVEKNFWVMIYQGLDLQTTIITLIILLSTVVWLRRAKRRVFTNI